jgi:4-hydroxy-3-methylbut-2-enyl diphosphate reductase
MELILAQPRGFCAGVERAIDIVETALDVYPAPVYVLHEIVHNQHGVTTLQKRGAVFVDDIAEIPERAVTIFSAHGVANAVVGHARRRRLNFIDATCPLVTKVHLQCRRYAATGYTVIIIGHLGHREVEGTMGAFDGPKHVVSAREDVAALELPASTKMAYVTQTTLSIDDTREVISALKDKYPRIEGPGLNDICYATQNRQQAVRELARTVDLVLILGSVNSSNANRLREVGEQCGVPSHLIDDASALQARWFREGMSVAISAGASAPDVLVHKLINRLFQLGASRVRSAEGITETTVFKMPETLLQATAEARDSRRIKVER